MSKLKQIIQEKGIGAILKKIIGKVVRTFIYDRVDVLYLSNNVAPPDEVNTLTIYTCDWEEYQRWAAEHPRLAGQSDLAEQRFKDGCRCYIGKMDDGRLGHIIWTTQGKELFASYETGVKCKRVMDKEVGIVIDAWTPSYARGRNYYPQVMRQIVRDLLKEFDDIWLWVVTTNAPSIRGIKKSGYNSRFIMGRSKYFGLFSVCHFDDSPTI